jgi:hypothetical protein
VGSQEAAGRAQGQGGQLIDQSSLFAMTQELVKHMDTRFGDKILCAVLPCPTYQSLSSIIHVHDVQSLH